MKFWSIIRDRIGTSYLFSWDDIPGNDNERLIEYLKQKFGIDWVKTARIEKIDNGRAIRVSTERNSLLLRLNDKKTKINIEIDDSKFDELIIKAENGRLNIYGTSLLRIIWNKIGESNNQIQAIMVIILVSVTIWYAISTYQMTQTSKQDSDLNNRPWIYFEPQFDQAPGELRVNILLKNVGRVPSEVIIKKTIFLIGNEDYSLDYNQKTIIFPGQEGYMIFAGYINPTGLNRLKEMKYKPNLVQAGAIINYGVVNGDKTYYTEGYYNISLKFLNNETIKPEIEPFNFKAK